MHMVPLGKERAPAPSTTSSAAEDAAPAQHSRRRAGVIHPAGAAGGAWASARRLGTTHRALKWGIMSAKAGYGISVMRADLNSP